VGILCDREAKGAGRPPSPPLQAAAITELADPWKKPRHSTPLAVQAASASRAVQFAWQAGLHIPAAGLRFFSRVG
jgi:hypothetical protein